MQSSFEVVWRAIEFKGPDRLPVSFDSLGLSDIHRVPWHQIGTGNKELQQSVDEWGCLWQRSEQKNMGQVKGHPLLSWKDLAHYHWPNPDDPSFYDGMETRFSGSEGKYIVSGIFMLLFERMQALHGFENTLSDLLLEREKIEFLADKIVEIDLNLIRNIGRRFPGVIHGFTFTDDWGTQQDLFIKPRLWEDFFKPRYKLLFNVMHQYGWHIWMHSCGVVTPIIESLIEIGLDVINLQQPRALGIEAVGSQFAGRICFESLCDIQSTLPVKDADYIRAEAQLLLQHWGTPQGGFILSDYGDGNAIGVTVEKKQIMLKAFHELDPFRKNEVLYADT